jgi:uncharacterized heparinase superfamily protein
VARYARTAAHLQPAQIAQRARLRTQRAALVRFPSTARWLLAGPEPTAAVGWPSWFSPVDKQAWRDWSGLPGLRDGRIELLGVTRRLARPPDWAAADWMQAGAPALWRFHLHYWDWSWRLAAEPLRAESRAWFAALWRSWQAAVPAGHGDAWHPYPAALRAWSYCGVHRDLVAGSDIEGDFVAGLSAHAGFLRRHLESDVGGNHLIKNLKALTGLAVFFADDGLLDQTMERLRRQLAIQVLPDGGHFERAPAYHCQVLADLIDVDGLARAAGQPAGPELGQAIQRMRRWLGLVLSPGGRVPLLNDGYPVGTTVARLLEPEPAREDPLLVLPDTGMARAVAGGWHLLADVGAPCPDELPAHAHADTLSCLVHLDGAPLLIDTGTSTYAAGPVRDYERSTAAHNTVEVDGTDSTEVWGAFRAGRRARVSRVIAQADGDLLVVAAHDGYRSLPGRPVHQRSWSLSAAGLRVDDLVRGEGEHAVTLRWHLAPGSALQVTAGGAIVATPAGDVRVAISASEPITLTGDCAPVATGFGRTVDAPVLTGRMRATLPIRISTNWLRAGDAEPFSIRRTAITTGGIT